MSRALVVLWNEDMRARAIDWIRKAPNETRVTFKGPQRTLDQNARMWAMLTDIASQLVWYGVKLSTEDWKLMMLDGLKRELRLVPNINGDGFVNLGRSSSDLSVEEMTGLIELIYAFGAKHGVVWSDPNEKVMAA